MKFIRTIVLTAIASILLPAALRADSPLPADASVDSVLDALDQRGKTIKEFTAKLSDSSGDPDIGNETTHTGTIWFQRSGDGQTRVHILFDKLIIGHVIEAQKHEYLLDGEWLIDRNYDAKPPIETKRQVLKPGEKTDLLKLGAGPFPLPIGQAKADVLRLFDVTKTDPAKDDPPQTIHLQLIPKAKTDMAQRFQSIDIWIDRTTHMPVVIDAVSAGGGEDHRIEFKDLVVDPKPPLTDKNFTLPEIDSTWNTKTEPYGN
jgi:hypothetical protein